MKVKIAKTLNKSIDYRVGNILSAPFDAQEFDNVIFSFNGLMLIGSYEDRLFAVKEIRRLLKTDGRFIFTTPYLDNKTEKSYWIEKAETLGIDVNNMSWEQQQQLGDEQIEDYDSKFFFHVPFVSNDEKVKGKEHRQFAFYYLGNDANGNKRYYIKNRKSGR